MRLTLSISSIFFLFVISCFLSQIPVSAQTTVNLASVLDKGDAVLVDGAVDVRYRVASSGRTNFLYFETIELDVQRGINLKGSQVGNVFAQAIAEDPPDVDGRPYNGPRMYLGEAYVTYRLPVLTQTDNSAYLKVGQFPLPFGLIPVYDTHLQVMQSLYPEAIGERLDWGVGVEGRFYGVLDYRLAMTAGTGSDQFTIVPDKVVSFRLGRLFATDYGTVNVGGSMLAGKLPVTEVDPETDFANVVPASGKAYAPFGFVNKSRIAGDGQWTFRRVTMRGEAIAGADNSTRTLGFFSEGEYRLCNGLTAVIERKYWDYGTSGSSVGDTAVGLNVAYGNDLVIRGLYELQRNEPINTVLPTTLPGYDHFRHVVTVQAVTRF